MYIINQGQATGFVGFKPSADFSYTATPTITPVAATGPYSQASNPNLDYTVTYTVAAKNLHAFTLNVTDSSFASGHSFVSLTPSIATVDPQSGVVSYVSNGLASIQINTPVGSRLYHANVYYDGGAITYSYPFKQGTLAKHINDLVNTLISGKNPGTGQANNPIQSGLTGWYYNVQLFTQYAAQYPTYGGYPTGQGADYNSNLYRDIWETNNNLLPNGIAGATVPTGVFPDSSLIAVRNRFNIFSPRSAYNPSTPIPNGLTFSFASVINGTNQAGQSFIFQRSLISPRHMIGANHVSAVVGSNWTFLGDDGVTVHTATVVMNASIANNGYQFNGQYVGDTSIDTDIQVCFIDPPIKNITPVSLLPSNWSNYVPSVTNPGEFSSNNTENVTVPCWCRGIHTYLYSQYTEGLRLFGVTLTPRTSTAVATLNFIQPTDPVQVNWWGEVFSGDSSSPLYFVLDPNGGTNYQPVLLGHMHTGNDNPPPGFGQGGCSDLASYADWINAAMTSLTNYAYTKGGILQPGEPGYSGDGSSYQLSVVALNNFLTTGNM